MGLRSLLRPDKQKVLEWSLMRNTHHLLYRPRHDKSCAKNLSEYRETRNRMFSPIALNRRGTSSYLHAEGALLNFNCIQRCSCCTAGEARGAPYSPSKLSSTAPETKEESRTMFPDFAPREGLHNGLSDVLRLHRPWIRKDFKTSSRPLKFIIWSVDGYHRGSTDRTGCVNRKGLFSFIPSTVLNLHFKPYRIAPSGQFVSMSRSQRERRSATVAGSF